MRKYLFPAVLEQEETQYSVRFPDLPGCSTCGDNLIHALDMAGDALALMLVDMEEDGEVIPDASDIRRVQAENPGRIVNLIPADTQAYRRKMNPRAVKKTLTIPGWLNEMAERQNINFSQVLQEALMEKTGTK